MTVVANPAGLKVNPIQLLNSIKQNEIKSWTIPGDNELLLWLDDGRGVLVFIKDGELAVAIVTETLQ